MCVPLCAWWMGGGGGQACAHYDRQAVLKWLGSVLRSMERRVLNRGMAQLDFLLQRTTRAGREGRRGNNQITS